MAELIDREEVLKIAEELIQEYENRASKVTSSKDDLFMNGVMTQRKWGHIADGIEKLEKRIKEVPTIESRPKGKWIDTEFEGETIDGVKTMVIAFSCDKCGWLNPHGNIYNYCPMCGACMIEENTHDKSEMYEDSVQVEGEE